MRLIVIESGFSSAIQDVGRIGWLRFGVSVGGALDSYAMRVVNLLVGNDESYAGIEITLGKARFEFSDDRVVAWCGGEFEFSVGDSPVPAGRPVLVRKGDQMRIGGSRLGSRAWLAISGGVDVVPLLNSRSTDLRAGFGGFKGRVLEKGDEVPLGRNSGDSEKLINQLQDGKVATWGAPREWSSPARSKPTLRFIRGADWNSFEAVGQLVVDRFVVSPDSNRMGVRLDGAVLTRRNAHDLISEAVTPGTIQVPPGGRPILLLGDCQTIGGYPKIAHVITVDLGVAAQLRAGDEVRFIESSIGEAHRLLFDREKDLDQFRCGLKLRFS